MATIAQVTYGVAYSILPNYVYKDFNRMKKLWQSEGLAGPYFYSAACRLLKTEANAAHANSLVSQYGTFEDSKQSYFLMQYPIPSPIDLAQIRPESLPSSAIVLAPYFSIAVGSDFLPYFYYVLGQGPFGGTTLRLVTAEGANVNLGPGCAPELDAFLQAVKVRPTTAQASRKTALIPHPRPPQKLKPPSFADQDQ